MIMYLSIIIAVLILFILFFIVKYYKLKKRLKHEQSKDREYEHKRSFAYRELSRLQEQVSILKKNENDNIVKTSKIGNELINYNPIFRNKKALVGDYDNFSFEETRKILLSFGMDVDIVRTGEGIVDRIQNGYKYDIIFTNNVYQEGFNGCETLQHLKQINGFSTPVVIHTISEKGREYFVDNIGFDEYLKKTLEVKDVEKVLKKFLNENN